MNSILNCGMLSNIMETPGTAITTSSRAIQERIYGE
jgi:hypothetical protein